LLKVLEVVDPGLHVMKSGCPRTRFAFGWLDDGIALKNIITRLLRESPTNRTFVDES